MDCPSPRGRIVLRTQRPGDALSWGRFVRGRFVRGRIVQGRIVRVPNKKISFPFSLHHILHIIREGFPLELRAPISWCSEEHELIC
jgi:hypothetical protein